MTSMFHGLTPYLSMSKRRNDCERTTKADAFLYTARSTILFSPQTTIDCPVAALSSAQGPWK